MIRAWLTLAMLMPCIAFAAISDKEFDRYYPTLGEMYENCQEALAKADKGNLEGFYKSKCGIQATTLFSSVATTLHYIPVRSDDTEENARTDTELKLIEKFWSRYCAIKSFNRTTRIEIQIAQNYINFMDARRANPIHNDVPFDKIMQSRNAVPLAIALGKCSDKI